jgi:hypothetical protein
VAGTAAASFGASTAGAGAGVSFGTSPARAAVVLVGATEEMAAGAGAAEDRLARSWRETWRFYAEKQIRELRTVSSDWWLNSRSWSSNWLRSSWLALNWLCVGSWSWSCRSCLCRGGFGLGGLSDSGGRCLFSLWLLLLLLEETLEGFLELGYRIWCCEGVSC